MSHWLVAVEAGLVRAEPATEVISPAYDLLTVQQRARYAAAHPRSFLNATPSSELEDPEHDAAARRQAANHYLTERLSEATWEFREPALYVYRIQSGGHLQTGVVGDVPVSAFPRLLRPHEETRPTRVADLVDYLEAVGWGSSPVGVTYRPQPEIDAIAALITADPPELDVVLADGDRQTVWAVTDREVIEGLQAAFADVEAAYIIDGHHRVAATVARRADPAGPAGRFLAAAFPADDLVVYPFHRWVGKEWRPAGEPRPRPTQPRPGMAVAVTPNGEWECPLADDQDDATSLTRLILAPHFGIDDPRTDPRLQFIPGYPGPETLRAKVAAEGGVGFLLHPPGVDEVMAISDRGETMPPKATYFAPKPRSGIFLVRR